MLYCFINNPFVKKNTKAKSTKSAKNTKGKKSTVSVRKQIELRKKKRVIILKLIKWILQWFLRKPEKEKIEQHLQQPQKAKLKIAISSGHGLKISGAIGFLNEVAESRRVTMAVADKLRKLGADVIDFHDDISDTQADAQQYEVHFNAICEAIAGEICEYCP